MNYIFISPSFPSNFENFIVALKEQGVNVLGLGSEPYEMLSARLRDTLSEYYKVGSMENYDEMFKGVAYLSFKHGKIDRLESHNEYWLQQDARLRTDFNIPGFKTKDMPRVKRKSVMKNVFQDAGANFIRGTVIASLEEAEAFIAETGYPVCVKPDIGVGAEHTYKLNNREDLIKFFLNKPNREFIIEEFINGEIHTFDGLVDSEGNIVFYSSFIYNIGVMDMVNDQLDAFYYSLREPAKDLVDIGSRIVKGLELRERFFHIEFFRLDDGKLVALEINTRPPGGLSMDMFNYANDADLYKEYARLASGKMLSADLDRKYFVGYAGRRKSKYYKYVLDDILEKYGDAILVHEPVSGIFAPALGDYAFLFRSKDFEELQNMQKDILELG